MKIESDPCRKPGQSGEQAVEPVLFLLRSADFRGPVNRLNGYDTAATGDIVQIDTLLAPGQSIHRLSA